MSYSVLARTVSKNAHRLCSNAVVRYSLRQQQLGKRALSVDVVTKRHRNSVALQQPTFGSVARVDFSSRLPSTRCFSSAAGSSDGDSNDNDDGFKKPEPEIQSTGDFYCLKRSSR